MAELGKEAQITCTFMKFTGCAGENRFEYYRNKDNPRDVWRNIMKMKDKIDRIFQRRKKELDALDRALVVQ